MESLKQEFEALTDHPCMCASSTIAGIRFGEGKVFVRYHRGKHIYVWDIPDAAADAFKYEASRADGSLNGFLTRNISKPRNQDPAPFQKFEL